jgi:hypothetical protein
MKYGNQRRLTPALGIEAEIECRIERGGDMAD